MSALPSQQAPGLEHRPSRWEFGTRFTMRGKPIDGLLSAMTNSCRSFGPPPYDSSVLYGEANVTEGYGWICPQIGECYAPKGASLELEIVSEFA